ncbi:hypothetical protein GYMLUDRAFT_689224 [Collybiopsis luxurians FD-317 M1]|uniref:Unplaced genomic scaffold GYMLUscaffold_35, whole genome shotgun sequence n=1 Tax=Collybiopsis luxurians FD-317 M1 TaxID=944289 RepID=A0A0D0BTG5_9AGAR|nr:hypothetical protein GYMLUDRAFT_689224 [Collybiopsis luxurians FD-317 M1]
MEARWPKIDLDPGTFGIVCLNDDIDVEIGEKITDRYRYSCYIFFYLLSTFRDTVLTFVFLNTNSFYLLAWLEAQSPYIRVLYIYSTHTSV